MKPNHNQEIKDIIKAVKSLDEKLKTLVDASEDRICEQQDDIMASQWNGMEESNVLLRRKLNRMVRSANELNAIIENRKLLKQVLENMEFLNNKAHGFIP